MVWRLGAKNPLLRRMVAAKLLDGDVSKVELADMTPDDGLWPEPGLSGSWGLGRPLRTDHMPTRIEWRDHAKLPDVERVSGALVICDRLKEIVEQFEPGMHQFLPIEYVDKNGNLIGQRWFFVPCVRLDSLDRQHTTMVLTKKHSWRAADELVSAGRSDEIPPGFDVAVKPKMVFSLNKIGSYHVWCDKFLYSNLYISDALAAMLNDKNFVGIVFSQEEQI